MSEIVGYDGLIAGIEYATIGGPPEIYIKTKCPMTGGSCTTDCRLSKNGKCSYEESLKDNDLYRKIDNVIYDSAKTIGDKKLESGKKPCQSSSPHHNPSPHSLLSSSIGEPSETGEKASYFQKGIAFAPPDPQISHTERGSDPNPSLSQSEDINLDIDPYNPFKSQSSSITSRAEPPVEKLEPVERCSTEIGVVLHPNVATPTLKNIEDEIDKW